MSLNQMPGKDLAVCGLMSSGIVMRAMSFQLIHMPNIPLNPPDIVSKNNEGFSIDMNNMEQGRPYMMTFDGSKYVLWKNENGSLVIREV